MTLTLSIAMTLLAFTLAMLGRFSSKEHPNANRVFVVISILNVVVGIGSIINASLSSAKQVKMLRDLNAAQQKLLAEGNDQLLMASDLAQKLTAAEQTTKAISSELTRNTKNVGVVMTQTERALEPLGNLTLICQLELPSTNSEVVALANKLRGSVGDGRTDISLEHPDPRVYLLRPPPVSLGFAFFADSPLYPKGDTALGLLVRYVNVELQFHKLHFPAAVYASNHRPRPDLRIEFRTDLDPHKKWLELKKNLVLLAMRATVSRNDWRSDGTILSVRDLIHAQAVVHPIFAIPPVEQSHEYGMNKRLLEDANRLWSAVRLHSAILDSGDGRLWAFGLSSSKTLKVYDIPVFVGEFHRLVKPLDEDSVDPQ